MRIGPMELWEKQMRDRLNKTLPEGLYKIEGPSIFAHTGKQGFIDFQVYMHEMIKEHLTKPISEDEFKQ